MIRLRGLTGIFYAATAAIFLFHGCAGGLGGSNASSLAGTTLAETAALTAIPASTTIAPGAQVQISATGGTPPYSYALESGTGNLNDTTGLLTAPSAQEADEVVVRDSLGNQATSTITVSSSAASGVSSSVSVHYPMSIASSNDVLSSNWVAMNAVDGNPATNYGSTQFSTSTNDHGTYLAAWMKAAQRVSWVLLTPRRLNGNIEAFPVSYELYVTDPMDQTWIEVATFTTQPDSTGVAQVQLPTTYMTYGVLIVPTQIGVDDDGDHYFQLAEVGLGN